MAKEKVKIVDAVVEGQKGDESIKITSAVVAGTIKELPIPVSVPIPPTTTAQQDLTFAGQRRVNLIWETTQALIAIIITGALIYCATNNIESKELNYAFFLIVTMYFVRTNHAKIGGTGEKPTETYIGR